ncbi:FAD binding domain-containing protein [Thermodesulfobacteriota bacterium]
MITYMRYLPDFEYFAPCSVKEACSLLGEYQGEAMVMAGGTDLLVQMKHRTVVPKYVIGLKGVPDLDGIAYSESEGLRIGSLVSHQSIADSPMVKERFGALATACSKVGTPQVRVMGTVGGNLCNAAPSADSSPPLIAFSANLKLAGPEGERVIPLEEFFTGPGETVLQSGEMLSEIQVPTPLSHTGAVYLKLPARTAVDIAVAGVAALITMEGEICSNARIVLGAVGPTPIRAKRAEEIITGKKIAGDLIRKSARAASEECRPISDVRGSVAYRTEMVELLTEQAINQALEKAESV